ncbi:MAG: hypothetical protein H7336_04150 [Bacteriovorax sp.]|nr:hypothetical protein [Bacteriovorax sp.]
MKKYNSISGFTLIELMTTLGIMSFLVIVIMNSQSLSIRATGDLKRNNEVNSLIALVTSELSREEVCARNFNGKAIGAAFTQLLNKNLNASYPIPIISQNTQYGEELKILTMTTAAVGTLNKMNLTVNYQPKAHLNDKIAPAAGAFVIPINVFLDPFTGLIKSCYSDLQSALELAVQYSCNSGAANQASLYVAKDSTYKYGHCEYAVEIKDKVGTVLSPDVSAPPASVFSCPAGQLLKNINTSTYKMSFECEAVGTAAAPITCPNWSYLKGIDSAGAPICVDLRTIFPSTGFVVNRSNSYYIQNIDCVASAGAGTILQRINPDGSLVCVDPRLTITCGVNQYVATDASGNRICSYSSDQNACSAGMYMTAIDSVGNVTCGYPTLTPGCGGGQLVVGINSSAAFVCAANPP